MVLLTSLKPFKFKVTQITCLTNHIFKHNTVNESDDKCDQIDKAINQAGGHQSEADGDQRHSRYFIALACKLFDVFCCSNVIRKILVDAAERMFFRVPIAFRPMMTDNKSCSEQNGFWNARANARLLRALRW